MAEATTAPVLEVPRDLGNLSPTQYNNWRKTGEIPPEEPSKTPTSLNEKQQDQPAAKESEAVTEPAAKPAADTGAEAKPERKRGTGSLTYREMRAKLREQEAELQRLKTAPEEGPAPRIEEPKAKAEKREAKPRQNDTNEDGTPRFKTWEEYEDARDEWVRREAVADFEKAQTKRQQEESIARENREIQSSWKERVDKARAAHADFDEALDPEEGPSKRWASGSLLDSWILDSEVGAEMLYYFHTHRSEIDRIGAMKQLAAARELTRLEEKLSGELSKAPPAEKQEAKTTKVPPPTREVGGRGTVAVDEVTKAVADDDTRGYIDSMNRREIARKKR